ncbi:hypothetical protein C8R46DRAFT_1341706 [Mycena filopes]|nr:hypothetical protein C8R46DRAFT_1341706 [Mycena filopes]
MATMGPLPPGGDPFRIYHFPPFPPAPPGVTIIPFKDFTEYGACVVGEDGVERDPLGIPTVLLPRSKKALKLSAAPVPGPNDTTVRKDWWVEWEESGEDQMILVPGYDSSSDRANRFRRAVRHFGKMHKLAWYLHVQQLWIDFKIFAGTSGPEAQPADDDLSDDELDVADGPTTFAPDTTTTAETPQSAPGLDNMNDKSTAFLDAPARSIAVFLSSHMHDRGHMWDRHHRKLVSAPHLLRFFVAYLLRNKVLPESTQELKEALEKIIIKGAGEELPLLPQISQALPDAFSEACRMEWGRRAGGYVPDPIVEADVNKPKVEEIKTEGVAATALEEEKEEEENGNKTDHVAMDAPTSVSAGPAPAWGWGAAPSTSTNQVDDTAPAANGGWGSGGWGNADSTTDDNGDDVPTTHSGWGAGSGWPAYDDFPLAPAPAPAPEIELPPPPPTLSDLRLADLPASHAPGIVEQSPRRIKGIGAPQSNSFGMSRIVLAPWPEARNATADPPRVIAPGAEGQGRAHDVEKDEIVLLVQPEAAAVLRKGMGLVGTWVELAPRVETKKDHEQVEEAKAPQAEGTKGKAKGKKEREVRYWYMDELLMILPSYWCR